MRMRYFNNHHNIAHWAIHFMRKIWDFPTSCIEKIESLNIMTDSNQNEN